MLRVSFVLQAAAKLTKPDHNLPRTIRARTDQTTDPVPEGKVVTGPTCDPCSRLCSHLCIALARATDIVPEPGPLLSYYTTCRELSCLELLSHRAVRLLHIGRGIRHVANIVSACVPSCGSSAADTMYGRATAPIGAIHPRAFATRNLGLRLRQL